MIIKMENNAFLALTVIVVVFGAVSGQIIPKRPFGYVYNDGSNNAPISLDAHFGPLCPDSAYVFPVLKEVAEHYGTETLKLTLHMFPLPYHHRAYVTAIGSHAILRLKDTMTVYKWIDVIYKNLDFLSNDATANMTSSTFITLLSQYASQCGVDADMFRQEMMSEEHEEDTRAAWKYSCSKAIFGTPTYLLNDVKVDADLNTLADWKQVIDPLLGNLNLQTCPLNTEKCEYLPGKVECCTKGEACIPNVGCRCFGNGCEQTKKKCPSNTKQCGYLPGKVECCTPGEACVPNVGCRCFTDIAKQMKRIPFP